MCNEKLKDKIIEYFQDKKEVITVYLYGSIVTGKDAMNSDVDIALLTNPYKNLMESQRATPGWSTTTWMGWIR